jgi:hypothetical protein
MIKKAALLAAVLAAVILASGCVEVTTNTTPSNQGGGINETSGHALVQALIDKDANGSYRPLVSVTWLNGTTAHEHFVRNDTSEVMTTDITYSAFPSVTAASAYFDSLKNQYPIKPESGHEIYLVLVTGQTPTVYKALTTSDYNHYLTQEDTVVMQQSFQFQSINQA